MKRQKSLDMTYLEARHCLEALGRQLETGWAQPGLKAWFGEMQELSTRENEWQMRKIKQQALAQIKYFPDFINLMAAETWADETGEAEYLNQIRGDQALGRDVSLAGVRRAVLLVADQFRLRCLKWFLQKPIRVIADKIFLGVGSVSLEEQMRIEANRIDWVGPMVRGKKRGQRD